MPGMGLKIDLKGGTSINEADKRKIRSGFTTRL
jgi:hypothetical protein